jgi:hypothetical protein
MAAPFRDGSGQPVRPSGPRNIRGLCAQDTVSDWPVTASGSQRRSVAAITERDWLGWFGAAEFAQNGDYEHVKCCACGAGGVVQISRFCGDVVGVGFVARGGAGSSAAYWSRALAAFPA